jgi:hypothetical protein
MDAEYVFCRECGVGRLRMTYRPYVRLFQKHLFTIPDARCHQCDVCGVCEFDEPVGHLIRKIMLGTIRPDADYAVTKPLSIREIDEEINTQSPPI